VTIVINCAKVDSNLAILTASDLLDSTFHDFRVYFEEVGAGGGRLEEWLNDDDRFVLSSPWPGFGDGSAYVLFMPAGIRLIRFTLEAMVMALEDSRTAVLRILVPGGRQSLECWDSNFVLECESPRTAEEESRRGDLERWVPGASLGIYQAGETIPKQFVRRGVAGNHLLEVEVFEKKNDAVNDRTKAEIDELKREVRRLRSELGARASEKRALFHLFSRRRQSKAVRFLWRSLR
jgi:hypothetical protein